MRGEAQIRAAARDDQVTAERNGNKKDWRREKLGTLLDKLDEEVKEFKRAIDEEDREGIQLEGSDIRWTVTMIQDHHGVLELGDETVSSGRLQEGRAAAKLAYEEGNGLVALYLAVECVVELEERIQQQEEALRKVDKLLDLVAFPEAQRVIRAALSRSEAKEDSGE